MRLIQKEVEVVVVAVSGVLNVVTYVLGIIL